MRASIEQLIQQDEQLAQEAGERIRAQHDGLFCGDFSGCCSDFQTAVNIEKIWLLEYKKGLVKED